MHSQVTRVLIDPATKVAFGVEFVRDKKVHRIRANKEVILSAGAVNSPQVGMKIPQKKNVQTIIYILQILMLSGIGPKEELERIKVPVIQDLKVGHNLQDHVGLGGLTFISDKPDVSIVLNRIYSVSTLMKYAVIGDGPLTIMGGVEGLGFVKTKYANASEDFPDIQFHFISG